MFKFDRYELFASGFFLAIMTAPERLRDLILKLRPITTKYELIRIGSENDGGYLLPDDLEGKSAQNLPRWKNARLIMAQFQLYVYERSGFPVVEHPGARITIFDAPILNISATAVRDQIRDGYSIRYLVPEPVREEIEQNRYYTNFGASRK